MSISAMGGYRLDPQGQVSAMGDNRPDPQAQVFPPATPAMPDDQRGYLNAMMYAQSRALFANASASGIVVPPTWTTVTTFSNSWVSYGSPYGPVQYGLDLLGFVCLRGALASGTIGGVAFTLPVGFRPATNIDCAVSSGSPPVFGALLVDTGGNISPTAGSNTIINLAQVRFPLT